MYYTYLYHLLYNKFSKVFLFCKMKIEISNNDKEERRIQCGRALNTI